MRILVVEDDSLIRTLIKSEIQNCIHAEVIDVANGFQAITHLQQRRFDIVVSDQWMQDIHGTDILQFIEKNPGCTSYFALFTSDQEIADLLKKEGRCAVFLKPDIHNLLNWLIEACCINFSY